MLDKRKTNLFFSGSEAKKRLERFIHNGDCFPIDVVIHPTTRCNHSCDFCYHTLNFGNGEHLDYNIHRYLRLTEELKRLQAHSMILSGGGEPLMHPEIKKMIQSASSFPFSAIYTNLDISLDESLRASLSRLDLINVNINSLNSEEYRRVKGKQANLSRVKLNLKSLLDLGCRINAIVTLRTTPTDALEKTIEDLLSMGMSGVIISPAFDLDYRDGLMSSIQIEYLERLRTKVSDPRVRVLEPEERTALNKRREPLCHIHHFDITIGADETLYPCCNVAYLERYAIVDLKRYSTFHDAWKSKEREKRIEHLHVDCKTCWFAPANRRIEEEKR